MAGAFQSRPSRAASIGSTKPLPPAAATHDNGQKNQPSQYSFKSDSFGCQLQPPEEAALPANSLPTPAPIGAGKHGPQKVNGHATLQRPKQSSHLESSNSHLAAPIVKDQIKVEVEGSTEGAGDILNGGVFSHDPNRLLRDTATSDSATCSASKSPSATPDHRHHAASSGGEGVRHTTGLSRAQSGISNLRLPDGNVLEEGPFEAQLHSSRSSSASDESPPPQPSTPRHGSDDSPVAAAIGENEHLTRRRSEQVGTEAHMDGVQQDKGPDISQQDEIDSQVEEASIKARQISPLEGREQPTEIDHTPKAEMIVELFQAFLSRIGFDQNAISLQVNSQARWHGLPQVHAPAVVERHIPGLGVLSLQHRSGPP